MCAVSNISVQDQTVCIVISLITRNTHLNITTKIMFMNKYAKIMRTDSLAIEKRGQLVKKFKIPYFA